MAVASSKSGAIVWSVDGVVAVNSSSVLLEASKVEQGNAMVHVLLDECSEQPTKRICWLILNRETFRDGTKITS